MQPAEDGAVRGTFAGLRYTRSGISSTFLKRDDKYYVRTDGADGKLADFRVRYTFGVHPLQQYLIEFPGGRLQALSIAWDVGGKRWFHLYPTERAGQVDELHWTQPSQNWNFMCADCHSTALRKNYDAVADRYDTHWSEISVGCEACHGPGSAHVAWATARRDGKPYPDNGNKALAAPLAERQGVSWKRESMAATATRSKPRDSEHELDVCAQCHSRRSQIADGYTAGKPFLDYYRPSLLVPPLYHPDGQQHGEVYDWGSFLQSRMYASGVTCSDCHEPHGSKLRAEGNAVCTQCHAPTQFDVATHHHHEQGSKGAQCAACHMPTATYMVLDARHDHSLRVPRPDLSAALGTPNACNGCHATRGTRWAAAQVTTWLGRNASGLQSFGPALAAANAGAIGAGVKLRATASDVTQPAIARATAFSALNANANGATLNVVATGLHDLNPLVRMGALDALSRAPADLRRRYALPLVFDAVRLIRIQAAGILADVSLTGVTAEQRAAFERAAEEYVQSQRYNADRPDARGNLGSFEARRGDSARAEEDFKAAIALDPLFVPAYVNLADFYRVQQRESAAEAVLREGLKRSPRSGPLHHALGLTLVRTKRADAALAELATAAKLEPANARFAYVYAVALQSSGHMFEAIATLVKANASHPADRAILEALVTFERGRGNETQARHYAEQLDIVAAGL